MRRLDALGDAVIDWEKGQDGARQRGPLNHSHLDCTDPGWCGRHAVSSTAQPRPIVRGPEVLDAQRAKDVCLRNARISIQDWVGMVERGEKARRWFRVWLPPSFRFNAVP